MRSQSDTDQADLGRERKEFSENAEFELDELAQIYVMRGIDPELARRSDPNGRNATRVNQSR